ncbi:uncharacterized protein LOC122075102 [Macadamia integrifolia]|uniref:uncharacterized protein LOC122075102 n=1 Tax=Macadamia integrifolia TaxID=60698 RepID=UPI001C502219|nr:uncharacterized protein LOC122075102 [Macadamia integrifolia]
MKPSYTIDDLSIPVLNVLLGTPPTDNTISLTIKVLNPNRAFSIHFYYINVTLNYGAQPIGNTDISNITQLKPTQTSSLVKSFTVYQKFTQVIRKLAAIDGKVEVEEGRYVIS